MISIVRDSETSLVLWGHAHSGEYGKDLVCAAVSVLVLTLEANLKQLHRNGKMLSVQVHLEPGNAWLRCTPRREHRAAAQTVFDNICEGFQMLAKMFPENVRYFDS